MKKKEIAQNKQSNLGLYNKLEWHEVNQQNKINIIEEDTAFKTEWNELRKLNNFHNNNKTTVKLSENKTKLKKIKIRLFIFW